MTSLIDTWLLVKTLGRQRRAQPGAVRAEGAGMAHSNQIREFLLTDHGIELSDVYVGPQGVLHRFRSPGPGSQGAGRRAS